MKMNENAKENLFQGAFCTSFRSKVTISKDLVSIMALKGQKRPYIGVISIRATFLCKHSRNEMICTHMSGKLKSLGENNDA